MNKPPTLSEPGLVKVEHRERTLYAQDTAVSYVAPLKNSNIWAIIQKRLRFFLFSLSRGLIAEYRQTGGCNETNKFMVQALPLQGADASSTVVSTSGGGGG